MRIVHISDTAFLALPEGACLDVEHCGADELKLSLPGMPFRTVKFSSVNDQGSWWMQMKAHVSAEAGRLKDFLMNASEGGEFTFQRVLEMGAPVADTPFRIREATAGGTE